MHSIALTIKPRTASRRNRKIVVEMDADRLEKLAAAFGMLNPDFLKSIHRAEEDYRRGRVYEVESLEELRG